MSMISPKYTLLARMTRKIHPCSSEHSRRVHSCTMSPRQLCQPGIRLFSGQIPLRIISAISRQLASADRSAVTLAGSVLARTARGYRPRSSAHIHSSASGFRTGTDYGTLTVRTALSASPERHMLYHLRASTAPSRCYLLGGQARTLAFSAGELS